MAVDNIGRPLKYKTDKKILDKAEEFFKECDDKKDPYTITGLAIALGTTRKTLMEWQRDARFSNTIKEIKSRVEYYVEKSVAKGTIAPAVGIFMLKNFGWVDKIDQTIEHKGAVDLGGVFGDIK